MRKNRRRILVVVAGLVAVARAASAQTVPSPFRYIDERQAASVFGGYIITDAGNLELGPESGPVGGLRYGFRLGGPFVAEASATLIPTTRMVWDTVAVGEPLVDIGTADLSLLVMDVSLRFDVTGPRTYHGFLPFLVAGGGAAFTVADEETAGAEDIAPSARFDFGTRFAGHVGAGLEWFATRRVSLRAEARDVFWKLKTPQAFLRQNLEGVPEDEWVQNFLFSLGLSVRF